MGTILRASHPASASKKEQAGAWAAQIQALSTEASPSGSSSHWQMAEGRLPPQVKMSSILF